MTTRTDDSSGWVAVVFGLGLAAGLFATMILHDIAQGAHLHPGPSWFGFTSNAARIDALEARVRGLEARPAAPYWSANGTIGCVPSIGYYSSNALPVSGGAGNIKVYTAPANQEVGP